MTVCTLVASNFFCLITISFTPNELVYLFLAEHFQKNYIIIFIKGMTDEEKNALRNERFWDFLAMVGSIIYGIFIVMLGVCCYMFDLFGPDSRQSPVYYGDALEIYLSLVGILWLCWLMYDIQKYINMMKEYYQNENTPSFKLVEGEDGELIISIPLVTSQIDKVPQYYCFSSGRHSGSFYLKIGAAIFCLGNIIHLFVIVIKQIVFLSDDKSK